MNDEHESFCATLCLLPTKPGDSATREAKKSYSESMSACVALAISHALQRRGLDDARPLVADESGESGAERRMAGAIGAKKVDVTWATDTSGLLLAMSIKTINFIDRKSKNFQKNLTNRRGDMLFEAVTLHRRFPYAVLGGLMLFDELAERDGTKGRRSTYDNAHLRLKLFTGRSHPTGHDEQFERLYVGLIRASPSGSQARITEVGKPETQLSISDVLSDLVRVVIERNSDFYDIGPDGKLISIR